MGAVITSTMTIVLLFNAPIEPSDINAIRSAVDEGSILALFVTDSGKTPVEPAADDWGLSKHAGVTKVEIRVMEQDPKKTAAILADITQAVENLPAGRAQITVVKQKSDGKGQPSGERGMAPAGSGGGMTGSRSGAPGLAGGPSIRVASQNPVPYGAMMGMPGGGRPVVLEGDLHLTEEESALWYELDTRARHLAARYRGEIPALLPGIMNPGMFGSEGGMGGMMGPMRVAKSEEPKPTPTENEKVEIEQELTEVLNQMFDLKLIAYERKISGIEEELQSLRNEIEERKENKNLIVERRLNELTGRQDHLAW